MSTTSSQVYVQYASSASTTGDIVRGHWNVFQKWRNSPQNYLLRFVTLLCLPRCYRGGRYYRKKLSIADKSVFFKLSANYRYRKKNIWELSKNYRYWNMCIQFHTINSIESTVPKTRKRPQRSTEETKKRPIIFIKRPKKAWAKQKKRDPN